MPMWTGDDHPPVLFAHDGVVADHCSVAVVHSPKPRRFVLHHKLPQVCGGKSVADNLIPVCDNCHYAIHIIMWNMVHGGMITGRITHDQLKYAQQGYDLAKAAGTEASMPKEA